MVAVAWTVCRCSHHTILHRPHRYTLRTGKVEPGMKRRFAGKGVCPRAVGVRDAPRRGIQRKTVLFRVPRGLHRQSRQQAEYQSCQHQRHNATMPSAYFCCLSAPFCPHTLSPPILKSVCTSNGRENINKKAEPPHKFLRSSSVFGLHDFTDQRRKKLPMRSSRLFFLGAVTTGFTTGRGAAGALEAGCAARGLLFSICSSAS